MTTDEAYRFVQAQQPALLYLTGKTCTGKTTFSERLCTSFGYEVIALDIVVRDAVIQPLKLQDREGEVFISVYKTAEPAEWFDLFVAATRSSIESLLAQNKKVIVDGAIS